MNQNIQRAIAIQQQNEKRIINNFGCINNTSGIYTFIRMGEDNQVCVYVGQARHLVSRLAQHLSEYDRIALSIKKHGLYNETDNINGWGVLYDYVPIQDLDAKEKEKIEHYKTLGYELYNVTSGGQGKGKTDIGQRKPSKTYTDGKKYGEEKTIKKIREILEKGKIEFTLTHEDKRSQAKLEELKRMIYGDGNEINNTQR